MEYKVLEMQKFFNDNYKLHAVSDLEESFTPVGNTDQEKRKSSLTFVKRMSILQEPLDELFNNQCELISAFSEFRTTYKMGLNENAFYDLASSYAKLEKSLKDFLKNLKKHSNQPEIANHFESALPYLSTNVFNMMKEDFEAFEVVTKERMEINKERYPDFDRWDNHYPNWETIKERYKGK